MAMYFDERSFFTAWQEETYDRLVLVEGDSWVAHPFLANLAVQLDDERTLMLNLGYFGDEAGRILRRGTPQFKRLRRLLDTLRFGYNFDLIFLSAAGNDIVGPEIQQEGFVHDKREFPNLIGRELLTPQFYDTVSQLVQRYDDFLAMRDRSRLNPETPVVTHTYSYLKPRLRGTRLGPWIFGKGWIRFYLEEMNILDEEEQAEIIREMLDAFFRRLTLLESRYRQFVVVDTREVLAPGGRPRVSLWSDEIHPRGRGFQLLARHIRAVARSRNCWPAAGV